MSSLMQMKIPLLASLLGLLLAFPSHAQTDGPNAKTSTVEAWKRMVVTQLASKKMYPPGATDQRGTATVTFAIDRQGKLISRTLVKSSGSELLDAAALMMVERAEPFPEPPAEVKDDGLRFAVDLVFVRGTEEQERLKAKLNGICRGC